MCLSVWINRGNRLMGFACFFVFTLVFFLGLPVTTDAAFFGRSDVETVKKGVLGLDKSTTIGNALGYYDYIKSPQWSSFEDKQKRKVVQFKAPLDQVKIAKAIVSDTVLKTLIADKKSILYSVQWSLVIQFRILPNDKFDVGYIGFENNKGKDERGDINNLKRIYKNEPTLHLSMGDSLLTVQMKAYEAE